MVPGFVTTLSRPSPGGLGNAAVKGAFGGSLFPIRVLASLMADRADVAVTGTPEGPAIAGDDPRELSAEAVAGRVLAFAAAA